MSNHKHAYGWSGHILARKSLEIDHALLTSQNVIAVSDQLFDRIHTDLYDGNLPAGMHAEILGIEQYPNFLALGTGFSEGWEFYGAPFDEAELRLEGAPLAIDEDAEYRSIMKSHYGLDLPPCRLMIGCSSEHC
jgi:hypothetical protein